MHQGGIRASHGAEVFSRVHYATVSDAVRAFANDTLQYAPGTTTVYSNQGFALLACAIEGASGQSFDAYLGRAIFEPAGMRHTTEQNVYRVTPHVSRSYLVRTEANTKQWEGLWTPAHLASTVIDVPAVADAIDPSWEPGAGNFRSTPSDMVRFVLALEREALVSDSMRARELTPQALRSDQPKSRGYGWSIVQDGDRSIPLLLTNRRDLRLSRTVSEPQKKGGALEPVHSAIRPCAGNHHKAGRRSARPRRSDARRADTARSRR